MLSPVLARNHVGAAAAAAPGGDSWPSCRVASRCGCRRRAYVVAGADWHEGVIGIVASRLVERYARPVVLIAGTDGDWKGSGRSIAGFDLHDALRQCAGHLERWGGHSAAAGLSIKPENVPAAFTVARRRGRRRRARRGRPASADARGPLP